MKQPYAYLRKSRVTTDRHVSWEVQEAAVKGMAGDDVTILFDWNKSGRKGADKRPGYRALLEAIEGDQVSGLFSYSLSRLSRSLSDFSRLVELCQAHGVPIRLYSEQHLDFTSASGRLMVNVLSAFAQMEAELAQERARDTVAVRRARGDRIGPTPFLQSELVIEAYREAGSINGAAKLLTSRGVPTRNGNKVWQATSVQTILRRAAPEELPVTHSRGVKKAAPFKFYRLLRCHCGRVLTGQRRRGNWVRYTCASGRSDPSHAGHQSITESAILDWAKGEYALHLRPKDEIQVAEANAEQEKTLRQRRDRLRRVFVDGLIDEAEYQAEKAALDQEIATAEVSGRALAMPPIDWDLYKDEDINECLRSLWEYVQLDEELRPLTPAKWWSDTWRRSA